MKSRRSLKQWVVIIKRYEHELPRLYEKLEYLEVKSIGYNSPSFEPKFGGRGVSNNYSIDYWLEKIDACEAQIKKREKQIDKFKEFTSKLNDVSKDVFLKYYYHDISAKKIAEYYGLKPYQIYSVFNQLRKFFNKKSD